MATHQTGRDDDRRGKDRETSNKTNFATKGIMPGSAEGTARSRRGGGIGGTIAELKSAFRKK